MDAQFLRFNDAQSIHVGLDFDKRWFVACGADRPVLASFRLQWHAEAFARAMAYSRHVEMVVHPVRGGTVRHARASLTYPTILD
ncbi:MAG: hypothetical protein NW216_01935 [Hyphomicrobium sp.]|nr:hypothetical protein [Hyphomicrobium sp.]